MYRFLCYFIISCVLGNSLLLSQETVSFDNSMKVSSHFDRKFSYKSEQWKLYRSLFETYRRQTATSQGNVKIKQIPKIIHFIWLGSPLPERCAKIIETWKKFHPSWAIKLWTDADIPGFQLQNQEAYDLAINWGEKSDIFRYEILYREGGTYSDTDMECLKPFDSLHESCEFFTGIAYDKEPLLYNGLIGSIPGHPILKKCIDSIKPIKGDQNHEKIMQRTGPYFFSRCFKEVVKSEDAGRVVPFPLTYFYPFPGSKRAITDQRYIKKHWVAPESFTVHYWATSWAISSEKKPEKKPKKKHEKKHEKNHEKKPKKSKKTRKHKAKAISPSVINQPEVSTVRK